MFKFKWLYKTFVPFYREAKFWIVILILVLFVLAFAVLFNLIIQKRVKQKTSELKIAKEKAEESDQLKTAFLENILHEVRTPMNSILGFSELLLKPDLKEEKQKQYVAILQKSTNQLLTIFENTITLAHLETNQLKINKMNFCVNELLLSLFEDYNLRKSILEKSNVDFVLSKTDDVLIHIYSDYTRLYQILSLLLDNAFKFTENGIISFGYYIEDLKIHFFIKDTGIGIPEDKQQTIFKSFTQANNAIRQNFGGLGVGLSIALGLVKLLEGEFKIKSKENIGTEIILSFLNK